MQINLYLQAVRAIAVLLGTAGLYAGVIAPVLAQTQPTPIPTEPGMTEPPTRPPTTTPTTPTPPSPTLPTPTPPRPTLPTPTPPRPTTPTSPTSPTAPTTPTPSPTPPRSTTPTPPTTIPSPNTTRPPTSSNTSLTQLLQQVSTQPAATGNSFTILAQAVDAADVAGFLQNSGPVTIFAPTDNAFAELPAGALQLLLRPENRNLLRQVLAYHVVPGEITSNQLQTGGVSTLGGGLAVRVTPERIIVNNGSIISADIKASNGVVHAINRVLLPPQIRQQLTTALRTQR